jgi:hypothetical protein
VRSPTPIANWAATAAALEAGADPAVVAGWIQEVQSARFDAQHSLEQIRELGDMVKLLSSASQERKARIYAGFGMLLTYHQARRQVQVSQAPLRSDMGQRFVSEGGLEPPCPNRALAPQASASAYSATRTHLDGPRTHSSRITIANQATARRGREETVRGQWHLGGTMAA